MCELYSILYATIYNSNGVDPQQPCGCFLITKNCEAITNTLITKL